MKQKIFILTAILKVLFVPVASAQVILKNTGTLYVSNTTDTLFINGDLNNSSAASLTNNGQLYVRQDITNDQAGMTVGTGTLYLNGSGSIGQVVSGSQAFKTYNLVSNNTAGFILNNNLSVSGVHTFINGLIGSSVTPNYLIYEAGSSYTGESDSRHVTGWVKKFGSANFSFPVGDNSYLRPISLSNLSASSEFDCHYYTPTQNTANLFSPLVQVKANEYWQVNKISGGTAQVTLNWDNSKVAMDNVVVADILTALYTSGNWTSQGGSATGNVTTTGTITSNSINVFGPLTFGYKSFPVPLKLISFTGERNSGISYLRWTTENEENVDHFEVQRSFDATTYTVIGNVSARNSGQREQYHLEDNISLQGLGYYRLRSVDIDGRYSYSRVVVVSDNSKGQGGFTIISPSHTTITIINKTGEAGVYNYRLLTLQGQQVGVGSVQMPVNGGAMLPLPPQIASGIYLLDLFNAKSRYTQRVLIDK